MKLIDHLIAKFTKFISSYLSPQLLNHYRLMVITKHFINFINRNSKVINSLCQNTFHKKAYFLFHFPLYKIWINFNFNNLS